MRLPERPWLQAERRGGSEKGTGVGWGGLCLAGPRWVLRCGHPRQTSAPRPGPSELSARDPAAGTRRCWGWNPSSCAGRSPRSSGGSPSSALAVGQRLRFCSRVVLGQGQRFPRAGGRSARGARVCASSWLSPWPAFPTSPYLFNMGHDRAPT